MSALEKELKYFYAIKGDLLRENEGRYALIRGENFFGVFESAIAAQQEGVNRFGNTPFLAEKVQRESPEQRGAA